MRRFKITPLNKIPNKPGVADIRCLATNQILVVASAFSLKSLMSTYFSTLSRNKCNNPKLQDLYNQYGPDQIVVSSLKVASRWQQVKEWKYNRLFRQYQNSNVLNVFRRRIRKEVPVNSD